MDDLVYEFLLKVIIKIYIYIKFNKQLDKIENLLIIVVELKKKKKYSFLHVKNLKIHRTSTA